MKSNWIKILAVILLVLATGSHPYGYYQLLRWVVTLAGVYSAYVSHEAGHTSWVWMYIAIAVLFNPISPFYLERATWQFIDIATAVILAISVYKEKPYEKLA